MRWMLILCIAFLFSCKNDTPEVTTGAKEDVEVKVNEVKEKQQPKPVKAHEALPRLCNHITPAFISSVTGIAEDALMIKNNLDQTAGTMKSCFFKWDDPNVANAGTMVQVMMNPIPDEVPNFHEVFIQGKKESGEMNPNTGKLTKYKNFEGFGDDGAYSPELGKYIWRVGNDFTYMVAFNTDWSAEKQTNIARKIASKIMEEVGH